MKRTTAQPEVSVALPFYNAEATIAATLESILAQSLECFELLAIDDGSTDGSAAIVRRYARSDRRIRLIRRPHGGVVAAANCALALGRAALMARVDADDRIAVQRLERQRDFLREHPEVVMVGSQVAIFPEERISDGMREYIRWQNRCLTPGQIADNIYIELPLANPTTLFRRDAVRAAGGYLHGPFPEDYELQLRLHRRGHQLAKLDEVLVDWRDSDGRLTRTDPRYSREAFDRLRAAYLVHEPRLQGRPLAIWGAGRKTRRRVAHLLDHRITPQAWIDIDPNKIGNRLKGVPVVAPDWLAGRRPRPFVLGYVASHGARELIAADLERFGYRLGSDYLMVG